MSTKRKQATATPPANPGHAAAAKQRATAKQQHGIHPPAAPKAIAAPVKPPAAPVRPPPDSDEEDLEAIFGKKKRSDERDTHREADTRAKQMMIPCTSV